MGPSRQGVPSGGGDTKGRPYPTEGSDVSNEAEPNRGDRTMPAPAGSDPTITFLSGVTSDATVAQTSFGSWFIQDPLPVLPPITYHLTDSLTTKWGDTDLEPSGTPGGNVTYWFVPLPNQPGNVNPPWDATAIDQWHSALALWSAVANITFTQAQDQASADFLLVQSNTTGTNQSFPTLHLRPSIIGEPVVSPPSMAGDSALPRVTIGTDTAPLNGLFETSGFQGGDSYYAIVHELGAPDRARTQRPGQFLPGGESPRRSRPTGPDQRL